MQSFDPAPSGSAQANIKKEMPYSTDSAEQPEKNLKDHPVPGGREILPQEIGGINTIKSETKVEKQTKSLKAKPPSLHKSHLQKEDRFNLKSDIENDPFGIYRSKLSGTSKEKSDLVKSLDEKQQSLSTIFSDTDDKDDQANEDIKLKQKIKKYVKKSAIDDED
jgi:hypothetical protein